MCNLLEIVERVVLDVWIGRRAHDVRAYIANTERVTIWCGVCSTSGADGSARTGDVLDDEGLAKRTFYPLAQHTREYVQ